MTDPFKAKPFAVGPASAMSSYLDAMDARLRAAGVRHFHAREVMLLRKAPHGPIYAAPPIDQWDDLVGVCRYVAEPLREMIGVPLKVLNGYRPPDYNRSVKGASRSSHIISCALDLTCGDADEDGDIDSEDRAILRAHAADLYVELADQRIGVGFYWGNVHVEWGRRRLSYASRGSNLDEREIAAARKRAR